VVPACGGRGIAGAVSFGLGAAGAGLGVAVVGSSDGSGPGHGHLVGACVGRNGAMAGISGGMRVRVDGCWQR